MKMLERYVIECLRRDGTPHKNRSVYTTVWTFEQAEGLVKHHMSKRRNPVRIVRLVEDADTTHCVVFAAPKRA